MSLLLALLSQGSGPNVYNDSVSESIVTSESLLVTADASASLAGTTSTSTSEVGNAVYPVSFAETSIAASESLTPSAIYPATLSETSVSTSTTEVAGNTTASSLSETVVSTSTNETSGNTTAKTLSETSIAATDSTLVAVGVTVAETAATSDAQSYPAGTVYNDSISESNAVAETASSVAIFAASLSETSISTGSTESASAFEIASLSETSIATSDSNTTAWTTSATASESIGTSTSESSNAILNVSAGESAATSDSNTTAWTTSTSVAESTSATTSESAGNTTSATLGESVVSTSTVETAGNTTATSVNEATATTTTQAATNSVVVSASETSVSTDTSQSSTAQFASTLSEISISSSESISSANTTSASLSDTAVASSSTESSSAQFAQSISETAATSDFQTSGNIFSDSLSDTATTTTTESETISLGGVASETISTSDSAGATYTTSATLSETATTSQAGNGSVVFVASINETAGASSVESSSATFNPALAESVSVSDSNAVTTIVYVADSNGVSEAISVTVTRSASVSETTSTSSTQVGQVLVIGSPTHERRLDSTMLTQNTPGTVNIFMRSKIDHLSAVDGIIPAISLSKAGSAFVSVSRVITPLGNGVYSVALTSADTSDVGELLIMATDNNCDNALVVASVQLDVTMSTSTSAINTIATGFNLVSGSVVTGDYTDTHSFDSGEHHIAGIGSGPQILDINYTFNVGSSAKPVSVTFIGHVLDQHEVVKVMAYNFVSLQYEEVGEVTGYKANNNLNFALFTDNVNSSGDVRIRFYCSALSDVEIHVDQLYVSYATITAGSLSESQATMLLEMYELLGLDPSKPLMVTQNSRTAGTISQTILTDTNSTIVQRN